MMNIVDGGSHSDAPTAFQDMIYLLVPFIQRSFTLGCWRFHALKGILHDRGLVTAGDEGGFAQHSKELKMLETILKQQSEKVGPRTR